MLGININTNFFKKASIEKYFRYHFLSYILLTIFGILLNRPYSPILTIGYIFLINLYVYFIHRLFHNIPEKYNFHLLFHHNINDNKKSLLNRVINLIIETILNIGFFISFYFIKEFFHLKFISNILIFYTCILYVSIHIINYSLLNVSETHIKHHNSEGGKTCNYGPDIFDHIFATNCDDKYENMEHIIINIIVSYFITCIVFNKSIF